MAKARGDKEHFESMAKHLPEVVPGYFICKECKSPDVILNADVKNLGTIDQYWWRVDNFNDDGWCNNCKESKEIITDDEENDDE